MNLHFILKSSIILSLPSIAIFLLKYLAVPDPNAFLLIAINIIVVVILLMLIVRSYVNNELKSNGFPRFIQYFVTFILILSFATTIHFTVQYLMYNHLDSNYKFEEENAYYQSVRKHRVEKGLPLPKEISVDEIEEKYGFWGLIKYFPILCIRLYYGTTFLFIYVRVL